MDTIELIGEEAALRGLVSGTLKELEVSIDGITNFRPLTNCENVVLHTLKKATLKEVSSGKLKELTMDDLELLDGRYPFEYFNTKPTIIAPNLRVMVGESWTGALKFGDKVVYCTYPLNADIKSKAILYTDDTCYIANHLWDWYASVYPSYTRFNKYMTSIDSVYELRITADDVPGLATKTIIHVHLEYGGTNRYGEHEDITADFDVDSEEFDQNDSEEEVSRTVTYEFEGHSATADFVQGPSSCPYVEVGKKSEYSSASYGFIRIEGLSPIETHDAYISRRFSYYSGSSHPKSGTNYAVLTLHNIDDLDIYLYKFGPSGGTNSVYNSAANLYVYKGDAYESYYSTVILSAPDPEYDGMFTNINNYSHGKVTAQDGKILVKSYFSQASTGYSNHIMLTPIFLIPKNIYRRANT